MKTSEIRRALRRRWPATVAVIAAALALAYFVHGQMSTAPTGQATAQILVDSPSSSLVNVNVNSVGLTAQAAVLAQAMTSSAVLQQIAAAAGVPDGAVSAQGPFNGGGEQLDIATPSEARAAQVVSIKSAYHVAFVAQMNVPIITATVQGPNPQAAGHVADAVLPGVEKWLGTIDATSTLPVKRRLVLRQLGDAQAGPVNSHAADEIAIAALIAVLVIGLLAVVLVDRRLAERSELRRRTSELDHLEQAFQGPGKAGDRGPATGAPQSTEPDRELVGVGVSPASERRARVNGKDANAGGNTGAEPRGTASANGTGGAAKASTGKRAGGAKASSKAGKPAQSPRAARRAKSARTPRSGAPASPTTPESGR